MDLDLAVAVHHQRSAGEGVGVERHQHHGVQARVHDRPAAGQGVGGGAGGRGDDQTVGTLAVHEQAVDGQFEVDHVHAVTGEQHHVVEGAALPHHGLAAPHFHIQQEAAFGGVVAVQHLADPGFDLGRQNVGEKAQMAAVDAQHRHVEARQIAGRAQQAAVAAHHDHQVTGVAHLRRLGGLQAGFREAAGDRPIQDHGAVATVQKMDQLPHRIQRLFTLGAGDQSDIAKFFLGHVLPATNVDAFGVLFQIVLQGISIVIETAIQHEHIQPGVF